MNTYHCQLIHKGFVQRSFFRQGESLDDVSQGLDMFEWQKGEWRVELAHMSRDEEE